MSRYQEMRNLSGRNLPVAEEIKQDMRCGVIEATGEEMKIMKTGQKINAR